MQSHMEKQFGVEWWVGGVCVCVCVCVCVKCSRTGVWGQMAGLEGVE